jgi:membrane fusion protein, multidrug efflux system
VVRRSRPGSELAFALPEELLMGTHSLGAALACVWLAGAVADPPEVPVSRPVPREVADFAEFAGRTAASRTVEVRARVSGYLTKVAFRDGAEVKEGDLLFEIDPRPYRAEAVKGRAAVEMAQARLKRADADYRRAQALAGPAGFVGPAELERAAGRRDLEQARLRAAKAALESAEITLSFTQVTAPISGRVGRRLLDPGNFARADETQLATLVTTDPLYIYFDVDERTLLRLGKGKPLAKAPAAVGLADEQGFPHKAEIDFVDNQVDAAKGTVRVRALLPNPGGWLRPGLFARVRVATGEPYRALLVPEAAVATDGDRKFVYVVNEKDVVEARPVTLGPREGESVAVKGGLKATDRVVVGELQRLRPGMAVKPRPAAGDKERR